MIHESYDPANIALIAALSNGGGGGGSAQLDALIDKSITVVNSGATSIGRQALAYCTSLKTAVFPNATSIIAGAFSGCSSLEDIDCPKVETLGSQAFHMCSSLKNVNLPKLKTVEANSNFRFCSLLEEIDLPELLAVGDYMFASCSALKTVNIPKATSIGTSAFSNDSALSILDLPMVETIADAFGSCSSLSVLILRASSVCALSNTTAFYKTPFANNGTGGTLYVPQALISNYQSASNWSTILGYPNNQIKPIEGSVYEEA